MGDYFLICFSYFKPDEPMDMSVLSEAGGEPFQQKLQSNETVEIENPPLPAGPTISPQASTPVSQSTPVFTPGLLSIPSQPEFSHVSVVERVFSI
jgi:hypothetical protein